MVRPAQTETVHGVWGMAVRRLLPATVLTLILMATAAAADLRDPTAPFAPRLPEVMSAPSYAVSAIFVSAERSLAILNGRRVGVGDEIDGARVVAIKRTAVILAIGDRRVSVSPSGVVTPVSH